MASLPPMESVLHLGFRFEPTPQQAVSYYLPRLIAGEPMHPAIRAFIHAADIYAAAPGALAAQFRPTPGKSDRFFFTTVERQRMRQGKDVRYVRVAGPGSWTFQRSDDVKDEGGSGSVKVGEVRKLRYKYRNGGAATDWLMEEYSCACGGVKGAVVGDKERVFCMVYVSPNAAAESPARQESAAFFSAAAPEPAVVTAPATVVVTKKRPPPPPLEPAMVVARKRPPEPAVVTAPAIVRKRPPPLLIVKPACPKRIRGAPISPIRPPSPAAARTIPSLRPCAPQKTQMQKQPGCAPAGPVQPPRPSQPQQQQATLPKLSSVPRQLLPPRASAPVKQEPLTPRAVPAPVPAPEDDDFNDFISDIEAKLEASEVQVVATSWLGDVHGVDEQGQQVLLPPQDEADDDMDLFASSLNDVLHTNEEIPPLPQKEEHKYVDPFEAAFAEEQE